MKFRTAINHPRLQPSIPINSATLFVGSCFSENISAKFDEFLLPCLSNPFGILYNPISIHRCLDKIIKKQFYSENELQLHKNYYCSLDHHGSFNSQDPKETINKINHSIEEAHSFLKQANCLILSFGTSYVYQIKESAQIVANCHRLDSHFFKRELILFPDLLPVYQSLLSELKAFNPRLQVIFTVSPIRHLRDKFSENQVSKAQLLSLTHLLQSEFENCHYFPSYEIMMDDLRDYRFYEEDMIHPNKVAIDYIWEQFKDFAFSPKDQNYFPEIQKLQKRLKHRLRNPDDPQSIQYQKETEALLLTLKTKYPFANWNALT